MLVPTWPICYLLDEMVCWRASVSNKSHIERDEYVEKQISETKINKLGCDFFVCSEMFTGASILSNTKT